jgi:glycosyltransferase involved in cell wall biosynthesis
MRIALVAPLAESIPPRGYGGTERVCSWLTEALVSQGHEVTLFASGDSTTAARLVACAPAALRAAGVRDHTASLLVMLDRVRRLASDFDVIHFHIDLYQFPLFGDLACKSLTTLHGRLDLPDIHPVYQTFRDMPLVSISDAQRRPLPNANWLSTVHHGMPGSLISYMERPRTYLAFLGRISPEKRPDRAIEIAIAAGFPLKLAAKIDAVDRDYFDRTIRPYLGHPLIEFVGEISDAQKEDFLGGAKALLFPIDWPEPFGLVMIEAMAAGTPIIAWPNGSVPEVVEQGVTGFVVDTVEAAVAALSACDNLDRGEIRRRFELRFEVQRMAARYLTLYRQLMVQANGDVEATDLKTAAAG